MSHIFFYKILLVQKFYLTLQRFELLSSYQKTKTNKNTINIYNLTTNKSKV